MGRMSTPDFTLVRNPFGRLVFTAADGEMHESVVPVRAFPIGEPERGIALVSVIVALFAAACALKG